VFIAVGLMTRVHAGAATLALVVTVGMLPAVTAQSAKPAPAIPQLSGILEQRGRGDTPPADWVGALTTRAKAIIAAFDEYAAPKYDCVAATSPRVIDETLYNVRIEQLPDRVNLYYEKDDVVRTVWLQGHNHPEPKPGEYFLQGYSTGRYENSQLVVETTKFTYDPHGISDASPFIPSTQRKKVTERYSREGNMVKVDVVTEDPLILTKAVRFGWQWEFTKTPWMPFDCSIETNLTMLQFLPKKYPEP
jgi:hypothetical protein